MTCPRNGLISCLKATGKRLKIKGYVEGLIWNRKAVGGLGVVYAEGVAWKVPEDDCDVAYTL